MSENTTQNMDVAAKNAGTEEVAGTAIAKAAETAVAEVKPNGAAYITTLLNNTFEEFQKANDRSYNLIRLHPSLQEKLKELLMDLESAARSEDFAKDILTQALFLQFMVYLNRIFLEKQYIFDRKSYSFDSQIAEILQYINHNLQDNLSVDQLASRYYISKYHLMRKFKEETGYTLHNYIVSKRLLMARNLISEGMPVVKAAHESGFTEYSTFSRAYRRQFGQTPSESR